MSELAVFFPALAHTDSMGYIDQNGIRKMMSVRRILPESMQERALISLSFDEQIHYETQETDGDHLSTVTSTSDIKSLTQVFVDCGAFHYSKMDVPTFLKGGFVRSSSAFREAQKRHLSRRPDAEFLLCAPDHIIHSGLNQDQIDRRREFTRRSAKSFLRLCEGQENVTAVGVVHGLTREERVDEVNYLISLGYNYIAFGGLVPLARDVGKVLSQLAGIGDPLRPVISEDSPLGIALRAGVRTHMFGLNSPDWYRWWKRLGVTSFDGSKLSQEGAANGIIWAPTLHSEKPESARDLYRRIQIKGISSREWSKKDELAQLIVSEDGIIDVDHAGWSYLISSRCTSPKCPNSQFLHSCDPRVTGSIEHNMGRMVLNAYAFEGIMRKVDSLVERATNRSLDPEDEWLRNWEPIEVG